MNLGTLSNLTQSPLLRMPFFLVLLAIIVLLLNGACGHNNLGHLSPRELQRRETAAVARRSDAQACSRQISEHHEARKVKRDLVRKRNLGVRQEAPRYSTLQNFTCVMSPETTEGPYYIRNELLRSNLTEDQRGVPLVLDIGVVDVNTCKALPNALVEIWQTNALGLYAGYQGGAFSDTFLRGGLASNENGIVELTTIYPGFYTGRTAHIHVMVHTDWFSNNQTIDSSSGSVVHVGQFFMADDMSSQVYAQAPYTDNTDNRRTTNAQDFILRNVDSDSAYLQLELLGSSLSDGLLGYITVVVNPTASLRINNRKVASLDGSGSSASGTSSGIASSPALLSGGLQLGSWSLWFAVVLGGVVVGRF